MTDSTQRKRRLPHLDPLVTTSGFALIVTAVVLAARDLSLH
jgi:hypothetical protein